MIVAMAAMLMMQMVAHTIIGVIAVRHRFVAATRAVHMRGIVTAATVTRGAAVGIFGGHSDHVLVKVTLMRVMQVTLVQVVDMPFVAHRRVAAAGAMLMGMTGVLVSRAAVHAFVSVRLPLSGLSSAARSTDLAENRSRRACVQSLSQSSRAF